MRLKTPSPNGPTERSIRIEADLERVWASWAEPEHVRRWFSDDASGSLEPGGELVHQFHGHGEHRYQVLEVEAPHRLLLEGRMMGGAAFRQEVTLHREDGHTVLTLVHSGFGSVDPDDEMTKGIDSGWTMALQVMKYYAERMFGRDKTALPLFRPARYEYEDLANRHYFPGDARGEWLATTPALGEEIARSSHELLLEWPEAGGLLELKAFGSGPDARVAGLRAILWDAQDGGSSGLDVDALRSSLEQSIEGLLGRLEA